MGQWGKAKRRGLALSKQASRPQVVQARQNKRQGLKANRKAYGALDRTLQDTMNDVNKLYGRSGAGFTGGLAGLSGMLNFGGGMSSAAGGEAFGGVAASGMRGMSERRDQDIKNYGSMRSQGALERKNNALDIVQAFQDEMNSIKAQQAANAASMTPGLWSTGLADKRARASHALEQERLQMQRDELARQQEFADWLAQNLLNRRGGGNNGGNTEGGGRGGSVDYNKLAAPGGSGTMALPFLNSLNQNVRNVPEPGPKDWRNALFPSYGG